MGAIACSPCKPEHRVSRYAACLAAVRISSFVRGRLLQGLPPHPTLSKLCPQGKLSDRLGRKPLIMFTILGTFTGFLIFANANALWMLFLARFIDGATGGNGCARS